MALSDSRDSKNLHRALTSLGDNSELREFLDTTSDGLTREDRHTILSQALVLIRDFYAHRPLKERIHAANPIRQLENLERQIDDLPELTFHTELLEIFKGLRDAHTNYVLPTPFQGKVAFLPFFMQSFFEGKTRKFLVTRLLFGFSHPTFKPGVEITHWNGTPVERAVQMNADREEGSNPAARFAFGLASMTVRGLSRTLPPTEEWVVVTYEDADDGESRDLLIPWRVFDTALPRPDLSGDTAAGTDAFAISISDRVAELHQARIQLFAPEAMNANARGNRTLKAMRRSKAKMKRAATAGTLEPPEIKGGADLGAESVLPQDIQFKTVSKDGKDFGYIRLRSFSPDIDESPVGTFVGEFFRILELMPPNGLIIDVRSNGGGFVNIGEFILQSLTPREIDPEPFQFINTPLTRELCSPAPSGATARAVAMRRDMAAKWGNSIELGLSKTGEQFSRGELLSDRQTANAFGQLYFGPVLLITDAMCYSTTDIFAAGFKDHEIGMILGVDDNTGAGGANVWKHSLLRELLPGAKSPIEDLPGGVGMRVSIRRSLRVAPGLERQPLEDLGVVPNERYFVTRNDLVNEDADLIDRAILILAADPARQLKVDSASASGSTLNLTLQTLGMDRVDLEIDGGIVDRFAVSDGVNDLQADLDGPAGDQFRLLGFEGGDLVANRVVFLS